MDKANAQLTGKRMKLFIGLAMCVFCLFFQRPMAVLIGVFLISQDILQPTPIVHVITGENNRFIGGWYKQDQYNYGKHVWERSRRPVFGRAFPAMSLVPWPFRLLLIPLAQGVRGFDARVYPALDSI